MDAQDAQDNQDVRLLHDLQSLEYKPLIMLDLLWIGPLQFPHYIPLFEKEPTGRSRMLADGNCSAKPWSPFAVRGGAARGTDVSPVIAGTSNLVRVQAITA